MIKIPGRIPIFVHPLFWVFAALIGFFFSQTLLGALIWIGIIFVSVLVHELGHALTGLCFNQTVQIRLVALGGMTSYDGPVLKAWQRFLIVLNGPVAGFLLFLLLWGILQFKLPPSVIPILTGAKVVNLIWSVLNLFPVLPLDGGQLLRVVMERFFGIQGLRISLMIGMILSSLASIACFLLGEFLAGALFFLFIFQNLELWRQSRFATSADQGESVKHTLLEGEKFLEEGNLSRATERFEQVRSFAPGGMLANTASQYLALIYAKQGNRSGAYELLLPIQDNLSDFGQKLLHELAAEKLNYKLVAKLSADVYQLAPSQATALHNARAFAALKQPEAAGGWIQTAWDLEPFDLKALLKESVFADVRSDPALQLFVKKIMK